MTPPTWKRRQARVAKLAAEHPPAAELLSFYGRVLALQEPIYHAASTGAPPCAPDVTDGPPVLRDLDVSQHRSEFPPFVRAIGIDAPEALAMVAIRLADSSAKAHDVLGAFASGNALDQIAADLDCPAIVLEFFPRAFMQPVTEAAAGRLPPGSALPSGRDRVGSSAESRAACPRCGWPPQLAVLHDEAEVRGQRMLLCALCSSEWVFPRVACPGCGTTSTDRLQYHESDQWAHVRVEECQACRTYIKAIDLRTDGLAVPVVDELASLELDLWAGEAGLQKLQPNLLGL